MTKKQILNRLRTEYSNNLIVCVMEDNEWLYFAITPEDKFVPGMVLKRIKVNKFNGQNSVFAFDEITEEIINTVEFIDVSEEEAYSF